MAGPDYNNVIRYLEVKKGIDDRSLNQAVWQQMADLLRELQTGRRVVIMEVGCGIGTMIERMLGRGLLTRAACTALDLQPEYIAEAKTRLLGYAENQGFGTRRNADGALMLERPGEGVSLHFVAGDLFDFAVQERHKPLYDMILAHAFLDLVDLDAALEAILSLIRPGGLLYFSLNFDGATIFEPQIHPGLDRQIEELYHETMDLRRDDGRSSQRSRTGRRLLTALAQAGLAILAAGSSDWIIHPHPSGYSLDEAYFLHFIIETIGRALAGRADPDQSSLQGWIAERHRQVERGLLTYTAHQIDVLARVT